MVEKKRTTTKTTPTSKKSAKLTASKPVAKKVAKASVKAVAKTVPKTISKKSVPSPAEVKVEKKAAVTCLDKNCPIHGNNKVRGRVFEGKVIRAKMAKTLTVEWPRQYYLSKYERFQKRRSRVKAHNPQCISAKEGDMVRIAECRPLSKSKNFVVLEVLS